VLSGVTATVSSWANSPPPPPPPEKLPPPVIPVPPLPPSPQHCTSTEVTPAGATQVPLEVKVSLGMTYQAVASREMLAAGNSTVSPEPTPEMALVTAPCA
jgi:hypothetical protein